MVKPQALRINDRMIRTAQAAANDAKIRKISTKDEYLSTPEQVLNIRKNTTFTNIEMIIVDVNIWASRKADLKSTLKAQAKIVDNVTIKTSINKIVQIGNTRDVRYF